MNTQYDFTQTGGFPLDQGVLNDEQNGILNVEQALANALGPLVIVSGCVLVGGVVQPGVVIIPFTPAGATTAVPQLLPFTGGTPGANVIVVETDADLTYFSGSVLPSQKTRVAAFGTDGVQVNPWASFVPLPSGGIASWIADAWQTGDVKEIDVTEAYIASNFDSNGIGMNSRLGWAICNGYSGLTVNRMGLFPVQRSPGSASFAAMGDTGNGELTLTADNIPELETASVFGSTPGGSPAFNSTNMAGSTGKVAVNPDSPNTPITTLPPYIVTLFIQKL